MTLMIPAGKSTLDQLLLRFREPHEGCILLGGHDLSLYRGDDLRRNIAVVSQQTHLFTGTLRENLKLANPDAMEDAIEQACRSARVHEFIIAQPEGHDTWVGEAGLTLSGGQARRIAIARALLKNARFLVLDEPTEGSDDPTAELILEAIDHLQRRQTLLVITHRREFLSSVDKVPELGVDD
jgi:ATP-binding cassette subfamily C protein CydC